jgi:hypothetical protein
LTACSALLLFQGTESDVPHNNFAIVPNFVALLAEWRLWGLNGIAL